MVERRPPSIARRVISSLVVAAAIGFATLIAALIAALALSSCSIGDISCDSGSDTAAWTALAVVSLGGLAAVAAALRRIWRGFPKAVWISAAGLVAAGLVAFAVIVVLAEP